MAQRPPTTRIKPSSSQEAARDNAFLKERERQRLVNAEKTQRLRALRLEKEAVEKAALLANPPPPPKTRKKSAAKV